MRQLTFELGEAEILAIPTLSLGSPSPNWTTHHHPPPSVVSLGALHAPLRVEEALGPHAKVERHARVRRRVRRHMVPADRAVEAGNLSVRHLERVVVVRAGVIAAARPPKDFSPEDLVTFGLQRTAGAGAVADGDGRGDASTAEPS